MTVVIHCECGGKFKVKPEHLGKRFQCPACGKVIVAQERTSPSTPGRLSEATSSPSATGRPPPNRGPALPRAKPLLSAIVPERPDRRTAAVERRDPSSDIVVPGDAIDFADNCSLPQSSSSADSQPQAAPRARRRIGWKSLGAAGGVSILLIVAGAIYGFQSASTTSPPGPPTSAIAASGVTKGNHYTNQFFGLSIGWPQTWSVGDIRALASKLGGIPAGDGDLLLVVSKYPIAPGSARDNPIVLVAFQNVVGARSIKNAGDYLRAVSNDLGGRVKNISSVTASTALGGRPFHQIEATIEQAGITAHVRMLATKIRGCVLMFTITVLDKKAFDEPAEVIKRLRFSTIPEDVLPARPQRPPNPLMEAGSTTMLIGFCMMVLGAVLFVIGKLTGIGQRRKPASSPAPTRPAAAAIDDFLDGLK